MALVPFFVGVANILRQTTKLPFFLDPELVVHNFPTRGRNPSSDMGIVVSLYKKITIRLCGCALSPALTYYLCFAA